MITHRRLIERAVLQGRVDREAGRINGVRIIGQHSKNGRRYTAKALKDAIPKYENAKVYVNHPKKDEMGDDRPWQDWVGNLENVHWANDGLEGDLVLRKASGHFEGICEAAESEKFNRSFGLSHEANGNTTYDRNTNEEIVDRIDEVYCVAIVSNPATTAGVFESHTWPAQGEIDSVLGEVKDFTRRALDLLGREGGTRNLDGMMTWLGGIWLRFGNWLHDPALVMPDRVQLADELRDVIHEVQTALTIGKKTNCHLDWEGGTADDHPADDEVANASKALHKLIKLVTRLATEGTSDAGEPIEAATADDTADDEPVEESYRPMAPRVLAPHIKANSHLASFADRLR